MRVSDFTLDFTNKADCNKGVPNFLYGVPPMNGWTAGGRTWDDSKLRTSVALHM